MSNKQKYYLLITTIEDFEYDIKNNLSIIGLPDKHKKKLEAMNIGDRIIFYIIKKKCFGGIAEISGEYFYDNKNKIWSDDFDLWPSRRKAKKIILHKDVENMIPIKPMLEDLTFIKNKHKWGIHFQGSLKLLPEEDYLLIENKFFNK